MRRTRFDNRLFLLGLCMMACSSAEETGVSFTSGTDGPDDDDNESTTTGDPPSPTASAGSSATTASTSLTSTTNDTTSPTEGSESTMGIDPSDTTVATSDAPTTGVPETSSSGDEQGTALESTTGDTTTGDDTTTSDGSSGTTTGGEFAPCGPYASNYAYCFYPDDPDFGYELGFYFCQSYLEDCVGVSDECDSMIEEWIACVSGLECKEWVDFPGCEDELATLQDDCGC